MALTLWGMVRDRIATVMQTVNASASHLFRETPMGIDVRSLPLSVYDGAYSVEFRGYTRVGQEINTTQEVDVQVRINVGFLFNVAEQYDETTDTVVNDKREYNRAVDDVLSIITNVMVSPLFEQVEFVGTTPMETQDNADNFAVVGIDFILSTRVTP